MNDDERSQVQWSQISGTQISGTQISWTWCAFGALSAVDLYAVLRARAAVFIVEQNCPYQDIDAYDLDGMHLIAWHGEEIAAYLRVLGPNTKFAEPSIGRVLTTSAFRGTGLGHELLGRGIRHATLHFPGSALRISAQAHLAAFYARAGFVCVSASYLEDGIPHIEMLRAAT